VPLKTVSVSQAVCETTWRAVCGRRVVSKCKTLFTNKLLCLSSKWFYAIPATTESILLRRSKVSRKFVTLQTHRKMVELTWLVKANHLLAGPSIFRQHDVQRSDVGQLPHITGSGCCSDTLSLNMRSHRRERHTHIRHLYVRAALALLWQVSKSSAPSLSLGSSSRDIYCSDASVHRVCGVGEDASALAILNRLGLVESHRLESDIFQSKSRYA